MAVGGPAAEAEALLAEGRLDEALGAAERGLEGRPGDPDLLNARGAALRGLGRYAEAAESYGRSLEADPRDRAAS